MHESVGGASMSWLYQHQRNEKHRMQNERISYGANDNQYVDLYRPEGDSRGLAFLIHGGFWRAKFDASLMRPMAVDLAGRGWLVANVEYRRAGNGGEWPVALQDVCAGIDSVAPPGGLSRVSIGHSAGGHLGLLSADLVDAVVALAPITDTVRCDTEGLGEGAAREFFGGPAIEHVEVYREASPLQQIPIGRRMLVVHGDADERVPVNHSRDFVAIARRAGDDVSYTEISGMTHLPVIDSAQPHWAGVVAWMETQT